MANNARLPTMSITLTSALNYSESNVRQLTPQGSRQAP